MKAPRQTNLYNPAFRGPREWLTLPRLLLAAGLLFIGTLAIAAWMDWMVGQGEGRIAQLQARARSLETSLQLQRPAHAAREKRAADEQASLQRQEQVLRRILEAAGQIEGPSRSDGRTARHSQVLEGLARASLPGLWLTQVELAADARALTLRGQMLDAAILPRYLARLDAEPVLAGLRFEQLELAAPPQSAAADTLGFVLQAAAATTNGSRP